MKSKLTRLLDQHWILILALWLSALLGVVYMLLIPPWQHHDEPNHFELAWLIAHRGNLPSPGDEDQEMRRTVAASMINQGFFEGMNFLPDLNQQDELIWIGQYSQIGQPPLYYVLAAVPIWLFRNSDVEVQLYTVRFTSLFLFLVTILAAYGITRVLTSERNHLRWMVPIAVAMLPGLIDTMTSANSDVIAAAMFSLFLWGSVVILKRGVSILRIFWVFVTAFLCLLSKETVYVAILLLPLVLLFAFFRTDAWRKVAWGLCFAALIIGIVAVFSWGDAALWYRKTNQVAHTRATNPSAPIGDYVFKLHTTPEESRNRLGELYQLLPPEEVKSLRDKTVTLGAWIWSTAPVDLNPITLVIANVNESETRQTQAVTVGETPTFYSLNIQVPANANRAWVILSAITSATSTPVVVFFDGMVMVEGEFPSGELPQWEDSSALSGTWSGKAVANLLRNPSAEIAGIRFQSWVDRLGEKILPEWERPSMVLYSLTDWPGAGWYYRESARNLVMTFWGKFGWGHIPLVVPKSYLVLGLVTLIGAAGSAWALLKAPRATSWSILFVLALATLAVWIFTWLRGSYYLVYRPFIPSSRYAYPVVIPTISLISLGWSTIAQKLNTFMHIPGKVWVAAFGLFLLALTLVGIGTIYAYYY